MRLLPRLTVTVVAAALVLPLSPAHASVASGRYEPGSVATVFGRTQGLQVQLAAVDISGLDQATAGAAVAQAVAAVRTKAVVLQMHPHGGKASTHRFVAGSLVPEVAAPTLDPPGDTRDKLTVIVGLSKSFLAKTVDLVSGKVLVTPVDSIVRLGGSSGVTIIKGREGVRVDRRRAPKTIVKALLTGTGNLAMTTVDPSVRAEDVHNVIVIRTGAETLQYFVGGKLKKSYHVATGQAGYPTPLGTFHVVTRDSSPSWYNPGSSWAANLPKVIGPGPDNPLGTRALGINSPGIYMHGVPASENSSIGYAASHGCIRMTRHDVEEFYPLVPVGTLVVIAH